MKKTLSEDVITNELKGRSGFFSPHEPTSPFIAHSATEEPIDRVRTPERANMRTDEQVNARTAERPKSVPSKRAIKRQSYNVYEDQHESLQRLEARGTLSGKGIFISEMVREALDDYLQKAR